ncbi:elongation of very long chain fatty acids protein 7-like [Oppia nitens]|uniref:elongation of very long chain fatty acids protein 7-like n=1 Tax=Oppia nitens TaxID=1686743 RepID=UPI0023DAF9CA|nr:elongation of very long chain fatty acids protein 7-like [Oppia nitens]
MNITETMETNKINILSTDPRADYYILCNRPELLLSIISVYLIIVTQIGPRLMKPRKPYELTEILVVHNGLLVLINGYFVWLALNWLEFGQKSLRPYVPLDDHQLVWTDRSREIFHQKILYFYTKLLDLLDTVFFVLRKKSQQITLLHVYHHISAPIFVWMSTVWCPQEVILEVFCLINSLVHTVMYFYYLLAAFGPVVQSSIRYWKHHLTQLQLIQFIILLAYDIYCLFSEGLANYPQTYKWFGTQQPIIFLIMFSHFYIKSYTKSKSN